MQKSKPSNMRRETFETLIRGAKLWRVCNLVLLWNEQAFFEGRYKVFFHA